MEKTVWIGMVEVVAKNKNSNTILGRAKGAFANILAFTESKESFMQEVNEFVSGYNLKAIDIYDVEPFDERLSKSDVAPELVQLAEVALKEKNVQPGTLHKYKQIK